MSTSIQSTDLVPVDQSSGVRNSLAPRTLDEAIQFSEILAGSSFVPKDFVGQPGNILVAIQWGMEIGLAPLQALQNIAVINGRPSIWGDAALALVQGHPDYVSHDEGLRGDGEDMVGWFTIVRRGQAPYTVEFSVADAKVAGLWKKAGPWTTSPKRMLRLRARGFGLRDKFADALKGIITREEAVDSVYADLGATSDPHPIQARPSDAGSYKKAVVEEVKAILDGTTTLPQSTAQPEPVASTVITQQRPAEASGYKKQAPAQQQQTTKFTPAAAQTSSERMASGPQCSRFYAIWKQNGKSQDDVDAYLSSMNIRNDKEIPFRLYEEVCEWAAS